MVDPTPQSGASSSVGVRPLDAEGEPTALSYCWWPLLWDHEDMRPTLRWLHARLSGEPLDISDLEQLRQLALNLWEGRLEGVCADEASVFFEVAQRSTGTPLPEMLEAHELAHRQLALGALQLRAVDATMLSAVLPSFVREVTAHLEEEERAFWPAMDRLLDAEEVERLAAQLNHRRTRDGRGSPREGRAIRQAAARMDADPVA